MQHCMASIHYDDISAPQAHSNHWAGPPRSPRLHHLGCCLAKALTVEQLGVVSVPRAPLLRHERDSTGKVMVWAVREVLGSLRDFLEGDKAFMELLPKPSVSYRGGISMLWFISKAPSKTLARVSPLKMFLLNKIQFLSILYTVKSKKVVQLKRPPHACHKCASKSGNFALHPLRLGHDMYIY